MLGKILGLLSIGESFSGLHIAQKLIGDLAVIVLLTIVGAMLLGAISIGALFECYHLLMRHGLDADMSALVTATFSLMLLGAVITGIVYKIRRIKTLQFKSPGVAGIVAGPVQALIKGFYQGLKQKRTD